MNREQLNDLLRNVIDPELGVNIVDLGLVYEATEAAGRAYVQMTLTTAGCPLHDMMVGGVRSALLSHPDIKEVEVDVVWTPAWTPANMSEAAKKQMGY